MTGHCTRHDEIDLLYEVGRKLYRKRGNMKPDCELVIEVSGGVVTDVYWYYRKTKTKIPATYRLKDWDNIKG